MKTHHALLLATLAIAAPASAITLAPGQSGTLDFATAPDTGTTLADTSYTAYPFLSDAGFPETFDSRVTRASDGSLTFWYTTTQNTYPFFPNAPTSLTLPGFSGLTTTIQQFSADPFSTTPTTNALVAGQVSRSANGDSLTIQPFTNSPASANTTTGLILAIAVTTNATSFQLSDTGYQPTYLVSPFLPPGSEVDPAPFLNTQPRPAFIPAIPEPLSLTTLPLALTALCLRRRTIAS